MVRYCTTILLGAFLLFQIQPQIARTILPWFGGGAAVWSTCMLFFQVLLLGGYAYAHLLNRKLRPGQQAVVHMSLLAVSLYFLPVVPHASWQPTGLENPAFHILLLLTATVGVPYLLLAATGPLMQAWFAREFEGRSPYRLYALSNVGSLVALLSFPFVFEPNLTIGVQAGAWAITYVAFAILCGVCAFSTARTYASRLQAEYEAQTSNAPAPQPRRITPQTRPAAATEDADAASSPMAHIPGFSPSGRFAASAVAEMPATEVQSTEVATGTVATPALEVTPEVAESTPGAPEGVEPTLARRFGWVGLAALPSVMLLAVTNTICQDLAVIPFFWVMPLALYLVTFILTFESERWYSRRLAAPLLAAATLALFLIPPSVFAESVAPQILLLLGGLFLCGMVCHGELVARKPSPEHLTGFYLYIAFGGALGGVFVAMLAPLFFDTYLETQIAFLAAAVVAGYTGFLVAGNKFTKVALRGIVPAVLVLGIGAGIVLRMSEDDHYSERSRNFFGTLKVAEQHQVIRSRNGFVSKGMTILTHGTTIHGRQAFGQGLKEGQGMTYYWPGSGIAHAMRFHPQRTQRPLRVGVVGLGAGTLAHYAQKGDHHLYFELDPAVHRVAEKYFTYMKDARNRGAEVDVRIGDARIQLARHAEEHGSYAFDILVVDAFSSDAIPVHLLTEECGDVYAAHLAEGGILAFHVSNRHLDLLPVVRGLSRHLGLEMRVIHSQPDQLPGADTSDWVLVTKNQDYLSRPELRVSGDNGDKPSLSWTDDFSSLWHVLK